jgi:hypothetical protein
MAIIRTKQIEKIFEGDIEISGSISVLGSATFVQSQSAVPAIIVSGSQEIVPTDIFSGSIFVQGLGTFADTGSNAIIDLGDESF